MIFLVLLLLFINPTLTNITLKTKIDSGFDYERGTLGLFTSPLTDDMEIYIKTRLTKKGFSEERIDKLIKETNTANATFEPYFEMLNRNLTFLLFSDPIEYILDQMENLDGVVLPGGNTLFETEPYKRKGLDFLKVNKRKSGPYLDMTKAMLEKTKEINKRRPFVFMATCLGFQTIILAESNNKCPIAQVLINNKLSPISFTESDSRYKSRFSEKDIKRHNGESLMFFKHDLGFTPKDFNSYKNLKRDYTIAATYNVDKFGEIIVAIEHKTLPIYATQFHTEKTLFDNSIFFDINHSIQAVDMAAKFASIDEFKNCSTNCGEKSSQKIKRDYHVVSVEYVGYDDKSFFISRNPDLLELIA